MVKGPCRQVMYSFNLNLHISHKSTSYTDIDLLPINDSSDTNMKNELKSFLKKQLNNDSDTNTNTVIGLDTMSRDKFSNF